MEKQQSCQQDLSDAHYLRAILRAPVYEVAQITTLQKMAKISTRLGNNIFVKREDRQSVHSFKLRGAYTMIASLSETERKRGVITASAGNHAQGVALSASHLGIRNLIVMPLSTAEIKVDAVRGLGGEVYLYGANFDEAKMKALALAEENGYLFIPPFDHPAIIAG